MWAQQPGCSLNNAAEQEQREEKARSGNGQMCHFLGATPATAEDKIPGGFRVGEAQTRGIPHACLYVVGVRCVSESRVAQELHKAWCWLLLGGNSSWKSVRWAQGVWEGLCEHGEGKETLVVAAGIWM